jgi:hypothetical protein
LLIDDIDAELDRSRIESLLQQLEGSAQTFVSTSRRAIANRYRERASVYLVDRGRALREAGSGEVSISAAEQEQAHGTSSPGELERAVREMMVDEESEQNATY